MVVSVLKSDVLLIYTSTSVHLTAVLYNESVKSITEATVPVVIPRRTDFFIDNLFSYNVHCQWKKQCKE